MPEGSCVLVIGTTADYVEWIRSVRPGRVVFVTSPEERRKAVEPTPSKAEEVLCNLEDPSAVIDTLTAHLLKYHLAPAGVACFDCESMTLAAAVASRFNLDYPSMDAVVNCRDKNLSKRLWREHRVDCPAFSPLSDPEALTSFFMAQSGPIVLKPMTGSGSELVYLCESLAACEEAYEIVAAELERRKEDRLYSDGTGSKLLLAEAMITGREYSCDFIFDANEVKVLRIAEKIKSPQPPFGTIGGYLLPAFLPEIISENRLAETLKAAASALGLSRCIGMADFIVCDERVFLLEMTPRPGGDCLPFLLRHALGVDMLALAVDFAAKQPVSIPAPRENGAYMGLRIHAGRAGVLRHMELKCEIDGCRILETHFNRNGGHKIVMPPADYDSWLLGHIIVKLDEGRTPQLEYPRICDALHIEIGDENE